MEQTRKALVVVVWKPEPGARDKQILLLRVRPERGDFWQPVTGKADEGESFAAAALREAQEESGLRFERQPQYLGMEYEFSGRHGPALERAYFLPVYGGAKPPAVKIDPKEHSEYRWASVEDALTAVKFDSNRQAIARAGQDLPPLFLSRRGSFFQEGEEITHERTAELLHRSLQRAPSGLYHVSVDGDEIDVIAEDTARFVKAYDRTKGLLRISDGSEEKLDPTSLRVRPDNSLSCVLHSGWEALFLSPAYYEIAKDVREISGKYVLQFDGRDHELRISH